MEKVNKRGERTWQALTLKEKAAEMDIGSESAEAKYCPKGDLKQGAQDTSKSTNEDDDDDDDIPTDLPIPLKPITPLSSLDKFPNPFERSRYICSDDRLVITGVPGIGKSYFLFLVLHLRRAQNLPTLYVRNSKSARLWQDKEECVIDLDGIDLKDLKELLPPDTWSLVDLSCGLQYVPPILAEVEGFIMQASSTRHDTSTWAQPVESFVMRPWSSSELICGRQLQKIETIGRVSNRQLAYFAERFGGSARDAYFYAGRPMEYEEKLKSALLQIESHTLDIIKKRIYSSFRASSLRFVPADVDHRLLSILPQSDEDRRVRNITYLTESTHSKMLHFIMSP
ncbi:hypothetical protein BDP27DRAFT_1447721 [Rhodocollybia butyracea]|uniref:Uncharacterized protein n=1 Tax=Rhodocollybia butyracea TaxID=206335 RepID=A0A9P5PUJ5_9AGAR|nr:hypothetical protein BDP27DRAFT_1447721 [Rhodocollybia butyracea]